MAELHEAESVDDVHDVSALGSSAAQHAKEGVVPEEQRNAPSTLITKQSKRVYICAAALVQLTP